MGKNARIIETQKTADTKLVVFFITILVKTQKRQLQQKTAHAISLQLLIKNNIKSQFYNKFKGIKTERMHLHNIKQKLTLRLPKH